METSALLSTASQYLLTPYDLDQNALSRVFGQIMTHSVDYADLYFQYSRSEGWSLEEGQVKSGSFNIDQGVGVRAVSGEKTAFAYSDEINFDALTAAASATRAIAASGGDGKMPVAQSGHPRELYTPHDPIASLSDTDKVRMLEKLEKYARDLDPRVTQVMAGLAAEFDVILVARSDGLTAADVRPLTRVSVTVIAEQGDKREQGSAGGGGRFDYSYFTDAVLQNYAKEAVHQAITNLNAKPAPAGTMTVVLGNGWPGILLHEAIGHGLEGDFNRKGSSAFSGRIGERVGAPGVTVVDDGSILGRRGSLSIDDEGTPSQENVLIEDGILKGYLQDRLNARLMGVAPTGNGRRESYAHAPMPRMTNTFMRGGNDDPAELLSRVKSGIFAKSFGGGQVDIVSGKFVFSCTEAYKIENGKLGAPIKGATLIGDGPTVLTKVLGIGNDFALDEGIGICGKGGQTVPAGVGQPTLLVDGLTIGGTA